MAAAAPSERNGGRATARRGPCRATGFANASTANKKNSEGYEFGPEQYLVSSITVKNAHDVAVHNRGYYMIPL